jgi:hypothetical protein
MVDVPASRFLRPWRGNAILDRLQMARIRSDMTQAAKSGGIFHIWWHPHNFGRNTDENLRNLETILQHYRRLVDQFGMENATMEAIASRLIAETAGEAHAAAAPQAMAK